MSNQILWDCHMHSSFSADSDTPMEDMIQDSDPTGTSPVSALPSILIRITRRLRIMKLLNWICLAYQENLFMTSGKISVRNWMSVSGSSLGFSRIWNDYFQRASGIGSF